MYLSALLRNICAVDASSDRNILGLAQNSRQVQPGTLFVASRGRTFDGRQYIAEAVANGAVAVLVDEIPTALPFSKGGIIIPIIFVPKMTHLLPEIAARFYDYPAKKINTIGITGTNGKTSCSHFIAQLLQALHLPCGVIGTLGSGFPGALQETSMTTPDTVALQKIFAEFVHQQAKYVAMEVSSHSIDQERIAGLEFEVGVFTNLSQDHLDYHGDMAAYGATKKQLFTGYPMRYAVINADDIFGQELIAGLPKEKVISYSTSVAKQALIYTQNTHFDLAGIRATVFTPWGEGELYAPLMGEFNLSNVLAVLGSLGVLGVSLKQALAGISQLKSVPGRMQMFGGGKNPWVVVDYAHTPDALEKTLLALRKHCQGTLHCLFGCGGDRDKGKRPLMGAIAERYADSIVITDDNPRHENPDAIVADIVRGLKSPHAAKVERNRSKAIQDIIQCAGVGDYVLVAGKGAEAYQQIGDEKIPFSDGERILDILRV